MSAAELPFDLLNSACSALLHPLLDTSADVLCAASTVAEEVTAAVNGSGIVVAAVELFGSVPSGLAVGTDYDVDVCVTLHRPHPADATAASNQHGPAGRRALERLTMNRAASGLSQNGFDVHVIHGARVPVLKCCTKRGTKVDVVIGHREVLASDCGLALSALLLQGVENTFLLRQFVDSDETGRFRSLAVLVKMWAARRGIKNPSDGTMSSYCLVLMVVSFLQLRRPNAVLPRLQEGQLQLDGWTGSQNDESVAELLAGFMDLHSAHSAKRRVISLNSEKFVSKKSKGWEWANYRCCVEDPILPHVDTAAMVQWEQASKIDQEFKRASEIIGEYVFANSRGDATAVLESLMLPEMKEDY